MLPFILKGGGCIFTAFTSLLKHMVRTKPQYQLLSMLCTITCSVTLVLGRVEHMLCHLNEIYGVSSLSLPLSRGHLCVHFRLQPPVGRSLAILSWSLIPGAQMTFRELGIHDGSYQGTGEFTHRLSQSESPYTIAGLPSVPSRLWV